MIVQNFIALKYSGYIAGSQDGIVTVGGQPAVRNIELLDIATYQRLQKATSLANGHYLFMGLDPARQYLVMCRDNTRQYEPIVWDYVTPATDLTVAEQQALWLSWQT